MKLRNNEKKELNAFEFNKLIKNELSFSEKYLLVIDKQKGALPVRFNINKFEIDLKYRKLISACNIIFDRFFENGGYSRLSESLKEAFRCNPGFKSSIISNVTKDFIQALKEVPEEEFDKLPYEINTPNGIIDLRTKKIRKHTPDDYFLNITEANYKPNNAVLPTMFVGWIKVMLSQHSFHDLYETEEDTIRFHNFMMILGYMITGETCLKKCFFFVGISNSGKSTLLEFFKHMLGSYAGAISIKSLMVRRTGDTTIRPEMVSQRNCRLIVTSEPEDKDILDGAFIKTLTGNDTLCLRNPHKSVVKFLAKMKLLISSNYFPNVNKLDDDALINRFILCECSNAVPKGKIDPNFLSKLTQKENMDMIFTAIVDYASKFYQNDKTINFHPSFKSNLEHYMMLQDDIVVLFWRECIVLDETVTLYGLPSISSKDLYQAFREFKFDLEYNKPISEDKFYKRFTLLAEMYPHVQKVSGKSKSRPTCFRGITLKLATKNVTNNSTPAFGSNLIPQQGQNNRLTMGQIDFSGNISEY